MKILFDIKVSDHTWLAVGILSHPGRRILTSGTDKTLKTGFSKASILTQLPMSRRRRAEIDYRRLKGPDVPREPEIPELFLNLVSFVLAFTFCFLPFADD